MKPKQNANNKKKYIPSIQPTKISTKQERLVALAYVIIGAGGILYLAFKPLRALIPKPPCPFYEFTGLLCPGCGTTRSLLSLFGGDLVAAWSFNPLMIIFLPVLAWGAISQSWTVLTGRTLPGFILPTFWIWLIFATIMTYGILRNIPLPIFDYIRP